MIDTFLSANHPAQDPDISLFTENSQLELGYCIELLLRLQSSKIDISKFDIVSFTKKMDTVGNEVIAEVNGTCVKLHIHTGSPENVLQTVQQYGEYLSVKIENIVIQHHSFLNPHISSRKPHKQFGVLTLSEGSGMKECFATFGTDAVLDVSKGFNVSEFVEELREINADCIFVFPCTPEIYRTAVTSAKKFTLSDVRVIPCRTAGDAYMALSMFDTSSADADMIENDMNHVIDGVHSGFIHATEFFTFKEDGTVCPPVSYPTRAEAVLGLAESLVAGKYDILLLLPGHNVSTEEAQSVYDALSALYKRTEVIMIDGGQFNSDYILSLE